MDITIPPNRPDLLSHIGLARELSGLLNIPMKLHHLLTADTFKKDVLRFGLSKSKIAFSGKLAKSLVFSKENLPFKIKVSEPELCPFYSCCIIKNVQVSPSPAWLKNRLHTLGKKSINNIVDITNWILLEWGQPLHAFDWNEISGGISVKKAKTKETFVTLEQKEIQFYGDELVISDDKKTLALAGIIGGKNSGVSKNTKDVLIESAVFSPYNIRRVARRFGLDTDSSFLFSRGVEAHTTLLALNRACQLIQRLAGGQVIKKVEQSGKTAIQKNKVMVSEDHLTQKLGYKVSLKEFAKSIEMMNSQVQKKGLRQVMISPPYYRKDLSIQEDFVEEWARIKGYDLVKEELPHISSIVTAKNVKKDLEIDFLDKIRILAKEQGYYQAINYSFGDVSFYQKFLGNHWQEKNKVSIQNPISQDLNTLRQSLLPGLFKNCLLNLRRGQNWGRLFEQGIVFFKNKDKENPFLEKPYLAFLLWGEKRSLWKHPSFSGSVLLDLKSSISALLKRSAIFNHQWQTASSPISFLHPRRRMDLLVKNQTIGWIGCLHPLLATQYKVREEVAMGELDLSLLLSVSQKPFLFQKLSDLPAVNRDLSVLVPYDQPVGTVLKILQDNKPAFCKSVSIVDYYEGVNQDKEHKNHQQKMRSVTFRLCLQGVEKTLSEQEITDSVNKMIQFLSKNLSISIR